MLLSLQASYLAKASLQVSYTGRVCTRLFLLAKHTWWAGAGRQVCCCLSWLCTQRGNCSVCKCPVEVSGFPGEEQPGLKRKAWGKRRCWGFTSVQAPFWVRYLPNPPSTGTDGRKTAQGNVTLDGRGQPLKKRESDVSINCLNKDQGSTRNVYFCSCAYMLVKLVPVDTACIVHVSIPQAHGQLSP